MMIRCTKTTRFSSSGFAGCHTCLLARSSEVTSSNTSFPKAMIDIDDPTSLKVKEEIIALDYFITNLQGEHKIHFVALMDQLAQNEVLLEEKDRIEREDAMEIASLKML